MFDGFLVVFTACVIGLLLSSTDPLFSMNSRKTAVKECACVFCHCMISATSGWRAASQYNSVTATQWYSRLFCLGERDLYGHRKMSPSDFSAKSYSKGNHLNWPVYHERSKASAADCGGAAGLFDTESNRWSTNHRVRESNLVDSASSHTLVSKIKPCMSKYNSFTLKTANGSLYQL